MRQTHTNEIDKANMELRKNRKEMFEEAVDDRYVKKLIFFCSSLGCSKIFPIDSSPNLHPINSFHVVIARDRHAWNSNVQVRVRP